MPDQFTPQERSRIMAAVRSRGTTPERALGELVRDLFPRRKIVEHAAGLPGKPDFYLPGLRLAIFADGCFWHGCPTHARAPVANSDYWDPKIARNVKRDRATGRELRRRGVRVVRIWEHELRGEGLRSAHKKLRRAAAK